MIIDVVKYVIEGFLMKTSRFMTMPFAIFLPIFYLQLDAVKQGLSESFAFYVVRQTYLFFVCCRTDSLPVGNSEC